MELLHSESTKANVGVSSGYENISFLTLSNTTTAPVGLLGSVPAFVATELKRHVE